MNVVEMEVLLLIAWGLKIILPICLVSSGSARIHVSFCVCDGNPEGFKVSEDSWEGQPAVSLLLILRRGDVSTALGGVLELFSVP